MQLINNRINTSWGKALALSIVYCLSSIICSLSKASTSSMVNRQWSMVRLLALSIVYGLSSIVCSAQLNYSYTAGKFMIKGKVIDLQEKTPVSNANVIFTKNGKGITCDNEGNFTLYVYKTDTLKFSSTGYFPKVIHMQDIDSSKYYTMEIQLMHDFVKIKDVIIYPFKNKEEFIDAFMKEKDVNKLSIAGIAPPKYSHITPRAKFYNPISALYNQVKRRRAANPDFKP